MGFGIDGDVPFCGADPDALEFELFGDSKIEINNRLNSQPNDLFNYLNCYHFLHCYC